MNYALKIQIVIALLGIAEAWLEDIVIQLKNPSLINYAQLNRKEHARSAAYWFAQVVLYLVISWGQVHYWYLLLAMLICNRRVFFEYSLKCFRTGKHLKDIEGNMFFDKLSRSIFGARGGYWELLGLVATIITINKLFLL